MLEKENGEGEEGRVKAGSLKGDIPLVGIKRGQIFGPTQVAHNSPWVLQEKKINKSSFSFNN